MLQLDLDEQLRPLHGMYGSTGAEDALSEVTKFYPPLKLRVLVDDITALLMVKTKVVAEMAKKVMKKLKEEVERKGLKMSVTEDGKKGKSKMIASCGFLENELRQFSREEGVTLADSVDTLGVDLRTRIKSVGAKEIARREKCRVRFSLNKKNKAFSKELHEGRCQDVASCRYDASKDLGSMQWGCSPRRGLN